MALLTMRFYFTVHPGDMSRTRIPEGCAVMLVASAFWDDARKRFRVRLPPADHISALTIDSGGFTAARRWGAYPWSLEQYVEFICAESRDVAPDFVACMDYACERSVDRSALATNEERMRVTRENELRLREIAPDLPWLGVLQGNTAAERRQDVAARQQLGLVHPVMGIGSICGRGAREAAAVIRLYRALLPGVRYHGFGLDVRTLDQGDDVALAIASWDSYAWNWPPGQKGHGRPSFLLRKEGESWSAFTLRLAEFYQEATIAPRLRRPRQIALEGVA